MLAIPASHPRTSYIDTRPKKPSLLRYVISCNDFEASDQTGPEDCPLLSPLLSKWSPRTNSPANDGDGVAEEVEATVPSTTSTTEPIVCEVSQTGVGLGIGGMEGIECIGTQGGDRTGALSANHATPDHTEVKPLTTQLPIESEPRHQRRLPTLEEDENKTQEPLSSAALAMQGMSNEHSACIATTKRKRESCEDEEVDDHTGQARSPGRRTRKRIALALDDAVVPTNAEDD